MLNLFFNLVTSVQPITGDAVDFHLSFLKKKRKEKNVPKLTGWIRRMKKSPLLHKIIILNSHWLIKLLLSIKYQQKISYYYRIIYVNCQHNLILFHNNGESTKGNDHPSLTGTECFRIVTVISAQWANSNSTHGISKFFIP